MIMSMPALAVAFAGLVPLMIYTIWTDVTALRIPNLVVLAIFVVFLGTGSWGLPLEEFAGRVAQGVVVFFIAYLVFEVSKGQMGGGDLKFIAAFAPFVPAERAIEAILIYAVLSLATALVFVLLRLALGKRETGLRAFDQELGWKFRIPVGVTLAITVLIFVGSELAAVA